MGLTKKELIKLIKEQTFSDHYSGVIIREIKSLDEKNHRLQGELHTSLLAKGNYNSASEKNLELKAALQAAREEIKRDREYAKKARVHLRKMKCPVSGADILLSCIEAGEEVGVVSIGTLPGDEQKEIPFPHRAIIEGEGG